MYKLLPSLAQLLATPLKPCKIRYFLKISKWLPCYFINELVLDLKKKTLRPSFPGFSVLWFTWLFLLGCPRDHLWLLCDIAASFFQIQWFFYHSASTDVCENTLLKISGPIDLFHILSPKLPLWLQGITQIMTSALTLIFLHSCKAFITNLSTLIFL